MTEITFGILPSMAILLPDVETSFAIMVTRNLLTLRRLFSMIVLGHLLIVLDAVSHLLRCCEPGQHYPMVSYVLPGRFISHMPLFGIMDIGGRVRSLEDKLESLLTKFQISNGKGLFHLPFSNHGSPLFNTFLTKKGSGNDIDVEIGRLLPLFSCRNYHIPCRILTEKEVTILSGLEGHWTRISEEDAKHMPEDLIRSMCGNSFHPGLIGSALGSNKTLRQWIRQSPEGALPYVANRETAHKIFTDLVNQVRTQINNTCGKHTGAHKVFVDPTLPVFETSRPIPDEFQQPTIHPASLGLRNGVELTKRDQRKAVLC